MANKWLKLFPKATRNKAEFLIDGEAYFKSVLDAIETAKLDTHYIYILGWMLDVNFEFIKGNSDTTLFQLLRKATERQVEVRILVWDNLIPEYAKLNNDAVQKLQALTNTKIFIDEYTFTPDSSKQFLSKFAILLQTKIKSVADILFRVPGNNFLADQLDKLILVISNPKSIGAHHEKVVIVKGSDGLIAFCGGIDINRNRVISTVKDKEYRFPALHDTACRVEGPAAYEILQRFRRRCRYHPEASRVSLLGRDEIQPKEMPTPNPYVLVVGTYNSPDGREKELSLKKHYLEIIKNADNFIYIEDQYLVNQDVAKLLNKKVKEPKFQNLIIAIQDSIETSDIFIPNRKRSDFIDIILHDTTELQKQKLVISMIDRTYFEKEKYHPSMHAKILIVDDEIAIIGSANVNQRSFTNDSETSVIVFDYLQDKNQNFARLFRIATWKSFLRKPLPSIMYEVWFRFPNIVNVKSNGYSILIKYSKELKADLDVRIIDKLALVHPIYIIDVNNPLLLVKQGAVNIAALSASLVNLNSQTITDIFDLIWEHVIDPKTD
jgi:phosphatidylserine/phosphatidylglycerophosphate/cardiolipin synthase-like enzyme